MMKPAPDMRSAIRTREKTITSYNRISGWYDVVAGGSERKLRAEGLRLLDAAQGEAILEIGVGTGQSLVEIARAVGDSGKACGIDISPRMVEIAEARAAAAGCRERIELRCCDAISLPYPTGYFDGLFMSFTLETFGQREIGAFLNECNRVIKMDGRACVVGMSEKGRRGGMMKLYEWAHARYPSVIDCRPIDVKRLLSAAGLEVVEDYVRPFWGLSVEIARSVKRDRRGSRSAR